MTPVLCDKLRPTVGVPVSHWAGQMGQFTDNGGLVADLMPMWMTSGWGSAFVVVHWDEI